MICPFWLFAGQRKSIAEQRKLLYILGSKMSICVGDEFDSQERLMVRISVRFRTH